MPDKTTEHLAQPYITLNGHLLPTPVLDKLTSIEIDDSLFLPDMFALHFNDPNVELLQQDLFKPGSNVQIELRTNAGRATMLIGELTAVEPHLSGSALSTLEVRGYDRSHRMNRIRQTKSYQQVTDSDLAKRLASAASLQADVTSTREVYPYLLQTNQTNWEFLAERARRIGYRLWVEDRTLHFKPPPESPPETDLAWGESLSDFHARLTTLDQATEVVVRGYDPKAKREIVGRATRGGDQPQIGISQDGGSTAATAHGIQGKHVFVHLPVYTQSEADMVAKAKLDDINSGFIQADGVCGGDPTVAAGTFVNLTGLGPRFNGRYLVTRALHRYAKKGYSTHFWVTGGQGTATITDLLNSPRDSAATRPTALGLVVGIVTNNVDPQNMGRVKVRFPWLADQEESWWCRMAMPMAGAHRGFVYFPEVNDEVVCGFELGDPNRAYVLGAVWNGSDQLPKPTGWFVSGAVIRRATFSRVGHNVVIDDDPPTSGLVFADKTGDNQIKINSTTHSTPNTIQMTAKQDMTVTVEGKIVLQAQGDIELSATGKVSIKGTQGVDIDGSPGITTVKGTQVQLN